MCDFQLIPCLQNATREQMHKIRQTVHFTDREYNRDHPDDKTANHHCFLFTFKDKAVGTVRLDFFKRSDGGGSTSCDITRVSTSKNGYKNA